MGRGEGDMGKLRRASHRMRFGVPIFLLVQSVKVCADCSGGEAFSHWEVFCAAHGPFLRMSVASVDSKTAGKIPFVISILGLFPPNSLPCVFFFFA